MEICETRENVVLINDNQKIFAVLHKPLQKDIQNKFPAVLFCHGFAGNKTGRFRVYVELAEELAKNGIAVLRIDFRGSGDSEGAFIQTTLSGQVSDALNALEFLNTHPEIDQERLGILGRSLGGAVTVLAAKKFQKLKSLVLWAPVFSLKNWQGNWNPQNKMPEMVIKDGQPVGTPFLKQLFEMRLEQEIPSLANIPLLHIQGEKDLTVTLDHQKNYQTYRENAKAQSEFMSLPSSDHEFTDFAERSIAINKTVLWFKNTL